MVSHHFAKFGGHRRSGSVDIMFLVAKEENSKCSRFNPPLLFNLQAYHIILVTRAQRSNRTNTGK